MAKLPTAPHPVDKLTTTELAGYIDELKEALDENLSDGDRKIVLRRLGEAYADQNERASLGAMPPAHEITHPHVLGT